MTRRGILLALLLAVYAIAFGGWSDMEDAEGLQLDLEPRSIEGGTLEEWTAGGEAVEAFF